MNDDGKDDSEDIYFCYGKDVCIKFCDKSKKMLIQYKTNAPLSVRLKNKTAIMLRLLLQNRGKIVNHCTIAKETGCNCYREGVENDDVIDGVKNIRNLLSDVLRESGIPDHVIKKIIVPVEKVGYKIDLS